MTLALYGGSSRFTTTAPGRVTLNSFSFGQHYDPANLGFGPMICHNDDVVQPGEGYREHPHSDLEIVTWVLDGVLLHTDSWGNTERLEPGDVQVMSAGSGLRHAEMADAASGPTRFLQTWLRPDEPGVPPTWRSEQAAPGPGLTTVVGSGALPIGTRGASLTIARLQPGETAALPETGLVHAFLADGAGRLEDLAIGSGDAVRISDHPGAGFTASEPTELLLWNFSRTPTSEIVRGV